MALRDEPFELISFVKNNVCQHASRRRIAMFTAVADPLCFILLKHTVRLWKTIVFQPASCRRIGIVIESTDDFMYEYELARKAIKVHDHLNELFEFGPTYI